MDAADILRALVRTVHLLAATAWVGGSIFSATVLAPRISSGQGSELAAVNRAFGGIVSVCVWLLLASGAILTVDRLADPHASGGLYTIILVVKVALSVAMILVAGWLGERAWRRRPVPEPGAVPTHGGPRLRDLVRDRFRDLSRDRPRVARLNLTLGVVVFALGALLTTLYERGLDVGP
ncbi:MAG: hypothetical protein HYY04_18370 [Chloroflexi bacterium]|nr:hypothetical protein [Chloroflexota bacterium]